MWSKTIGYDPYAASEETKVDAGGEAQRASLMLLARMSNLSGSESRGGCKKCGMLGHLSFQCRNAPLNNAAKAGDESDDDSDSSSASETKAVVKPKPVDEKDRRGRIRSRDRVTKRMHSDRSDSEHSQKKRKKSKRYKSRHDDKKYKRKDRDEREDKKSDRKR
jgi:hypothetical protein